MTIDELIVELESIKNKHGDVEVTVWQYAGGNEDLCDVRPVFEDEYGRVVLATCWNLAQISR